MDAFIYESDCTTATLIQTTTSLGHHRVKESGIKWLQDLGVKVFRYIVLAIPNSSIDLPFPNSSLSNLVVEKYVVTMESLPIPSQ